MIRISGVALLLMGSTALADLAQVSTHVNPAADALSRMAASRQFGTSIAALNLPAGSGSDAANYVYYSALQLPDTTSLGGGVLGFSFASNGGSGVNTGGGGGGSGGGGGVAAVPQTPAPGALLLGIIGMACVSAFKRRT